MKVPLSKPSIGQEEISAVSKVLESGWLAHGPKVKEFEENFANFIGAKHALAVNSCASALQLAIQSQDLHGEIICPSFSMSATANSIVNAGCKPVFADISPDSLNINASRIKEQICKDTVAIMPVHLAGLSCKMDEIMELANQHSLKVIEDSAEAIGAEYKGKKTGSFSTACFSFYPVKNITTGEGGMVTTDDAEIYAKCNLLKAHGIQTTAKEREKLAKPWERNAVIAGYNYRMPDILAAIGVEQLSKINSLNDKRREIARLFNRELSNLDEVEIPRVSEEYKHVYQMYIIKVSDRIDRNKFVQLLREKGIGASVHFDPPIHKQPFYKGFKQGEMPVTNDVCKRVVSLPIYPDLNGKEVEYTVSGVKTALKRAIK